MAKLNVRERMKVRSLEKFRLWHRIYPKLLGVNAWITYPKFLRWFLWVQILLGWLLATLFLAGVTGIVRKD
jgi:hypothetical protein